MRIIDKNSDPNTAIANPICWKKYVINTDRIMLNAAEIIMIIEYAFFILKESMVWIPYILLIVNKNGKKDRIDNTGIVCVY
jgi:hypothetical protein